MDRGISYDFREGQVKEMRFDKIIRNGTLVLEHGTLNACLAIKGEKIAAILQDGCDVDADEVIDASGQYVFPGGIDTHTHFFDPGAEYREDWECGTRAAASGGYTLVMEMPNSSPPVIDKETFNLKYERASRHAVVDFALWGGAIAGGNSHIKELHELGCIAFKGFTLDAGPQFKWLDHQQQLDAMEEVKKYGKILGFHAEDENIIRELRMRYQDTPWNLDLHDKARPYYAELIAIQNAVALSKASGCPLHICHLSIPEGAGLLKRAKADGVDVTVESCPHYFLLNHEDDYDAGTYALIQPPLRSRERMERMWDYLKDGTIDYLGTDHAPYIREDKEPRDGNGWNVAGGAPSIDISYPLMISEAVIKRSIPAHRLAALCAANAARRFGLYPQKGTIQVGANADLVLMDMDCRWKYSRQKSFSKSKSTRFPYEGKELLCRVAATFVRGTKVYGEGKIHTMPGSGKFIKRQKGV